MIKAKVLGRIKPETIVCLNGKNNLYLVEDDCCFTKDEERNPYPETNDTVWFDEWFWYGDIRQLKTLINI